MLRIVASLVATVTRVVGGLSAGLLVREKTKSCGDQPMMMSGRKCSTSKRLHSVLIQRKLMWALKTYVRHGLRLECLACTAQALCS